MRSNPFDMEEQSSWPTIIDPFDGKPIPKPPFATRSQAYARAARSREKSLHLIRLRPGHGNFWPLWDWHAGVAAEPSFYGLSSDLTEDLAAWMAEWLAEANSILQGPDLSLMPQLPHAWFSTGHRIARRLAEEVWAFGDVKSDFKNVAVAF